MPTWIPMFALPNIAVEEPIEIDGMALAATSDIRIRELAQKHENFANYLESFQTEFSHHLQPSIIIRRADTPELYRSVDALAGFRDAIALSVIPYSWSQFLRYGHTLEVPIPHDLSVDARQELRIRRDEIDGSTRLGRGTRT
jgi:hypothetical protein